MPFLIASIHLLLAIGVGAFFLRTRSSHRGYALLSAGVLGVTIIAFLFLGLSRFALLTTQGVASALVALAFPGVLGWRSLATASYDNANHSTVSNWWRSLDRWDRLALIACGVCLTFYLANVWAPPRGAAVPPRAAPAAPVLPAAAGNPGSWGPQRVLPDLR